MLFVFPVHVCEYVFFCFGEGGVEKGRRVGEVGVDGEEAAAFDKGDLW